MSAFGKVGKTFQKYNPTTARGLGNIGGLGASFAGVGTGIPMAGVGAIGNLEGHGIKAAGQGIGQAASNPADYYKDPHQRAAMARGSATLAAAAGGAAGGAALAPAGFGAGLLAGPTTGAVSGGLLGAGGAAGGGQTAQSMTEGQQAQEKAAKAEEAAANDLENRRNQMVQQVRSQFGSTGVMDARKSAQDAAYQQAMQNASGQLQSGLTQNRIKLAQSGQLGGSTDQQGQSGLLANYYGQLAQGAVQAGQVGDQFNQALQNQRLQTEQAIRGAGAADLSGARADLASLLNSAGRGQMFQTGLGTALPQLANMGSQYAQLRAQGA